LNVDGFYTPLLEWVRMAVDKGFIHAKNAHIIVEAKTVEEVKEKLVHYELPESRFRLDWTVQSPLEPPKDNPFNTLNGDYGQT